MTDKFLRRETAREEFFYWQGKYDEAKQESIDERHVQQLGAVLRNAREQL